MAQQISTNTFGVAKWVVSADATQGTHTTIAGALTSASSGDTIFIRNGTYTENLTLKAGVNLTALDGDSSLNKNSTTFNVKIIGKATATFTGNCSISNICLQTNSDFCLVVSGTNATKVLLNSCFINSISTTAVSLTSNGGSVIQFNYCFGNLDATGAYFAATSGGIVIFGGQFANEANSTVTNTFAGSSFQITNTIFLSPVATSGGSSIGVRDSLIGTVNTTGVALTGTSGLSADRSEFSTGTASAVSVGAGCTASIFNTEISSTNTNAITGAGSITYSALVFTSSSSTINTTTQAATYMNLGKYVATKQPAFLAYVNTAILNVTGDSTTYTIIFDTEVFDQDSNFNLGTSIFTAPITGNYQFTFTCHMVGGTVISSAIQILNTSNRGYRNTGYASIGVTTSSSQSFSVLADMDAADTVSFQINTTDSGGKVDDVAGVSSQMQNYVTGSLLC